MDQCMKEVVNILIDKKITISVMESCTGGSMANSITNIPGASEIFKFGAVTYSNEYKIKLGVDEELINKYTVYSSEVAQDMAKKISEYTNSNIKLQNPDITLYMIIELSSSTIYSCITNNKPLPINEFKPYLYKEIERMLEG